MKKIFATIILCCILYLSQINAIDVSVLYTTYYSPETPYVELNIFVLGKTVRFQKIDSTHQQAGVEVITTFSKDSQIVKFDKYILQSPISNNSINFLDLKRYTLPNGKYSLSVTITDQNDTTNFQTYQATFELQQNKAVVQQSDIQLINGFKRDTSYNTPFVKNGIYLEPIPFNYCHKSLEQLTFYTEVYNTLEILKAPYLIRYFIEKVTSNSTYETSIIAHKRREPKNIDVLLLALDISALPTGNYNLVVEIRNKQNELLSQKKAYFQRNNPYLQNTANVNNDIVNHEFVKNFSLEDLRYGLKAIVPQVDGNEASVINLLLQEKNEQAMKNYLFSYWANQNHNQPEKAFAQYMEVAKAVDNMYRSGFGYGFETDRGFVFLKYGRPDDIVAVEDEPSAPPYEIWKYNKIKNQTRVKFIFYNPSLGTNDFKLLHSTARGETNNPRWLVDLYKNAPAEVAGDDYSNSNSMLPNINRNAERYFNED
ncbi:MAG: GWxTD domain-containing protein [Saprospiraceae bacterium]